jgi:anti-sigma factor RsiW
MNCNQLSELSPLYLAGELDGARAAQFAEHLRSCSPCSAEMREFKDLDARLCEAVLAEKIDPSAIDRSVRQTIQAESQAKGKSYSTTRSHRFWIPAAAAIAFLALIAILSYRRWFSGPVSPVYTAVVHDHQVEVVEHARRAWVSDGAVIQLLAAKQGVPQTAFPALAPANYHLERAKLCPLDGNTYLHLVYTDGAHELSIFLHQGEMAPLPGSARGSANGKVLRTASVGPDYLAGFQSSGFTALVVTDQSAPVALDAARAVALVL